MSKVVALVAVLASVVAAMGGCAQPPDVRADAATRARQVEPPLRVALSGDSNTVLVLVYSSRAQHQASTWDATGKIGLRWEAEDAYPRVQQDVANAKTSPDILVMAFGHNDAGSSDHTGEGFTPLDVIQLEQLALTPDHDACTAIVNPYPSGTTQQHRDLVRDYRAWAQAFAAAPRADGEPVVVLVDLMNYLLPDDISSDGIHIKAEDASATRYVQALEAGVDACRKALA